MRSLVLLALLLAPLLALAQAQALLDETGEPLPWPQPLIFDAPVMLVTDTVRVDGLAAVAVYAQGADGRRVTLFEPSARAPTRVVYDNGWIQLTQGCGRGCYYSYLVDRLRGRAAGPLAFVLDVDEVRDRVVAAGAEGLVVLDPFDPASARAVDVPFDFSRVAVPAAALRRVAFLRGEDALAVTVCGEEGEEEAFEVPLGE